MAEQIYGLSEDDLGLLREMVDWFKSQPRNTRNRPEPDDSDQFTPDIYVALTPSGGIPARVGSTVGAADCNIYRIDNATKQLSQVGNRTRNVCNLDVDSVTGSIYVPVVKDKWNQFVVAGVPQSTPGTGTGTGPIVQAVLTSFNPATCVFTQKTFTFHHDGRLASIT